MCNGFDHLADRLRDVSLYIERDIRDRAGSLVNATAGARGITAEQAASIMKGNANVEQLVKVFEKLIMKDREVARRYGFDLAATGSRASSIASDPDESLPSEEDEYDEDAKIG